MQRWSNDEQLPIALQKAIDRLPSAREKQVLQNVRQQILESVRQEPPELLDAQFFPQGIPFYAATEAFNYFRSRYPDFESTGLRIWPIRKCDNLGTIR